MTISVFRSCVAPEHQAENDRRCGEIYALVQQSPGYTAHKLFTAVCEVVERHIKTEATEA